MDSVSPEKRSWVMAQVKGRNTRPEKAVRSLLHRMGYRFRLQRKDLPGKPDIVLPKYRAAIFVHGCYWHRHDCPTAGDCQGPALIFGFQSWKATGNATY